MPVQFPEILVGDPLCFENLSVFPLYGEPGGGVAYRLSDEALADESILVEEVSEGGSVPTLLVENRGDSRVLFLEGEELVGAKQNRVLNTSVLVGAKTKIQIPVSCVEQGRWGYKSRQFGSSGSHSPSKLRRALKASVSRSVKEKRGHASDQGAVWQEVAALHSKHSVESGTSAMSDAFDTYRERIELYKKNLPYPQGATGVAIVIGDKLVAADLFDKPATCEKVWERMLTGVVFDALEAAPTEKSLTTEQVEHKIASLRNLNWAEEKAVGEGTEHRAESATGDHASALALEETVVHASVVVAV